MTEPKPVQHDDTPEHHIKHIVISGGGVTGLSFYGILRETNRNKLWSLENIQTIYGTSIGSFLAVVLCLGYEWEILDTYFIKRPWQNLFKFDLYSFLNVFEKKGIFNIKIFEEMIGPLFSGMNIPINITMEQFYVKTGVEIHMFSTDLNSMCYVDISYKTHPDWTVVQSIYCSSIIPVVFEPYIYTSLCNDNTIPSDHVFVGYEHTIDTNSESLDKKSTHLSSEEIDTKMYDIKSDNIDTENSNKCYIDGGFFMNYPLNKCIIDTGAHVDEVLGLNKLQNTSTVPVKKDSTFFDYIMIAFNSVFEIVLNKYQGTDTIKITHEYTIIDNAISLQSIIDTAYSVDERIRLIQKGAMMCDVPNKPVSEVFNENIPNLECL